MAFASRPVPVMTRSTPLGRRPHGCPPGGAHGRPWRCAMRQPIPPLGGLGPARQAAHITPRAQQAGGSDGELYSGVYGQWRVEETDVREVTAYRAGISVATVALVAASSTAFLPPESGIHETLVGLLDPLTLLGASGLGLSLVLIHIYVAPLKRFLQLLWGLGTGGSLAIMLTQDEPVAQYVLSHPIAVLAVGPLFAAVTGLAFKEGLCYGKFEAAALFFVVPTLLLGHLTQILPESGERGLLAAFCLLAMVFASRKYTQPIKDDIGDKSVFEFQALSEEEQEKRIALLQLREGIRGPEE